MSRRLQVVVPDPVAAQLEELAAVTGDPPSTLAGQFVRTGVAVAATEGVVRSLKPSPVRVPPRGDSRAQWLEPWGGDSNWRAEMWGAVVALHGRYPRLLEALRDGWWRDESHTETLCALAVWRGQIDDAGEDPREELAFQFQLSAYSRELRQEGGGVASAWNPGAPPGEWS